VKLHASIVYIHASNTEGREFCVNGVAADIGSDGTRYSAADDGYITVCASPGDNGNTQIEWDRCGQPNTGDGPCIVYSGGVGGYADHCYNSGLNSMEENKCYTLSPERDPETLWPNNTATDSYWWIETPCDGSGLGGGSSGGGSGGGDSGGGDDANLVVITAGWGSDGDKVTAPVTTTKSRCKDAAGGNPQAKKLRMGVASGTATVTLGGQSYSLTNDVNGFNAINCEDGDEFDLETDVAVIFLLKNG
jgi:hypothetical protein